MKKRILSLVAVLSLLICITPSLFTKVSAANAQIGWSANPQSSELSNIGYFGKDTSGTVSGYTLNSADANCPYSIKNVVANTYEGSSFDAAMSFPAGSQADPYQTLGFKVTVDVDAYPYLYIGTGTVMPNSWYELHIASELTGSNGTNKAAEISSSGEKCYKLSDYVTGTGVQTFWLDFTLIDGGKAGVTFKFDYLFVGAATVFDTTADNFNLEQSTTAPTLNGTIGDSEYTKLAYSVSKGSANMNCVDWDETADASSTYVDNISESWSWVGTKLYMGVVVTDPDYTNNKTTVSDIYMGDSLIISLAPNADWGTRNRLVIALGDDGIVRSNESGFVGGTQAYSFTSLDGYVEVFAKRDGDQTIYELAIDMASTSNPYKFTPAQGSKFYLSTQVVCAGTSTTAQASNTFKTSSADSNGKSVPMVILGNGSVTTDSNIAWSASMSNDQLSKWTYFGNNNAGSVVSQALDKTDADCPISVSNITANDYEGASFDFNMAFPAGNKADPWQTAGYQVTVDVDKYRYLYFETTGMVSNSWMELHIGDSLGSSPKIKEISAASTEVIDLKNYITGTGTQTFWIAFTMIDGGKAGVDFHLNYMFIGNETSNPANINTDTGIAWSADINAQKAKWVYFGNNMAKKVVSQELSKLDTDCPISISDTSVNDYSGSAFKLNFQWPDSSQADFYQRIGMKITVDVDKYPYLYFSSSFGRGDLLQLFTASTLGGDDGYKDVSTDDVKGARVVNLKEQYGSGVQTFWVVLSFQDVNYDESDFVVDYLYVGNEAAAPASKPTDATSPTTTTTKTTTTTNSNKTTNTTKSNSTSPVTGVTSSTWAFVSLALFTGCTLVISRRRNK